LIHQTCLLSAVRTVIRADSDPVRQALFANLKESHVLVRLVFAVHEALRKTVASALLVSSYGLGVFLTVTAPRDRRASLLSVARHANARRQVARIAACLEPGACEQLNTRVAALPGRVVRSCVEVMKSRASFVRALRVVRRIDHTHGFLVACRAAAAMAWYARAKAILHTHRPEAVVVSSDTNPEEVGFTAAARALGLQRSSFRTRTPRRFHRRLRSISPFSGDRRKWTHAGGKGPSAVRSCSQDWRENRHRLTRHSSGDGSRSSASLRRKRCPGRRWPP
jgi:hypothetical protein